MASAATGLATLELKVERHFEEALELWLWLVTGEDEGSRQALRVNNCTVELVIDKSPPGTGPEEPPKGAFIKRLDVGGLKQPVMIQNMPSGLTFFTAVVATLPGGHKARSTWARTKTLPLTEVGRDNEDLLGNNRGKCRNCKCSYFRRLNTPAPHMNDINAQCVCRRCGCSSTSHEEVWSHQRTRIDTMNKWPGHVDAQPIEEQAPPPPKDRAKASGAPARRHFGDNAGWTARERCLFELSSKQFHPDAMAEKRRALCSIRGSGRVSVCCPTVESRQLFHEQLWNVFNASDWPDKELIVIETYQGSPSAFLQEKAKEDQRVIYMGFQTPRYDDWSIGLKRNMCTHLATGEFLANFDDDDLYAPNYISTMIEAMRKNRSFGVTLSSWYVYDVACCKMGFVDPEAMCEDPTEKENWLYGYGFSYVYMRKAALYHPYPDQNMKEDYEFFAEVRKSDRLQDVRSQAENGENSDTLRAMMPHHLMGRKVTLVYDEYGICVHTLHPKSTSHSWAKREVPMDEVQGLDIAELAPILDAYFTRFPRVADKSPFIGKFERSADRPLEVKMERKSFTIPCAAGATAQQVIAVCVSRISAMSSYAQQLALFKENPWENGKFRPDAVPLAAGDRIGLRTRIVWVLNETERGKNRKSVEEEDDEQEVPITVVDVEDETVSVELVLPHSKVKQQAVLDKLLQNYANRSEKAKQSAYRLRLAVRASSDLLVACDLEQKVGKHREFFARGLASLINI